MMGRARRNQGNRARAYHVRPDGGHAARGPGCRRHQGREGTRWRRHSPVYSSEVNGEASAFMMMNRNKRGIALDLKRARRRDALASPDRWRSTSLIENFRVGTLDRAGARLRGLAPNQSGADLLRDIRLRQNRAPMPTKVASIWWRQGLSGLMRITGEPGGPPTKWARR